MSILCVRCTEHGAWSMEHGWQLHSESNYSHLRRCTECPLSRNCFDAAVPFNCSSLLGIAHVLEKAQRTKLHSMRKHKQQLYLFVCSAHMQHRLAPYRGCSHLVFLHSCTFALPPELPFIFSFYIFKLHLSRIRDTHLALDCFTSINRRTKADVTAKANCS